jgi:alkylation response protein AidB-like acyl-CoA dehydrogenase
MDFSLSDHQKLIRDTVRQFMENDVRPSVRRRDPPHSVHKRERNEYLTDL